MRPAALSKGPSGGQPRAVRVVGIAGPSGSGKTTLAGALADRCQGVVFALDAYYRDQRGVDESVIDVDIPEAIDVDLLVTHLRQLVAGSAIDQPIYDYATHSRGATTRALQPGRVVLVEGLFALYWTELRAAMDARVFVALDHDECLRRRVDRDVRERGRTHSEVAAMYESKVRPMYERYVDPTRRYADLVLDGSLPIDTLTETLLLTVAPPAQGASPGEIQR